MKQKLSLLLAGLLLLLPLCIAGCSSPKTQTKQGASPEQAKSSSRQGDGAKGRYQEEEIPFPAPIQTIFDLEKKDGTVRILTEQEPGSFYCYKSQDEGASWQQEPWDASWLPEHYRVVSACFAPEGEIYVSAGKISENPLDEQHAIGVYEYFKLEEAGQKLHSSPLSLKLPEPKKEYISYGLTSITCPKTGTLVGTLQSGHGESLTYQLMGFDPNSGAITWERESGNAEIKAVQGALYLNEFDGTIKTLDAASGNELTEAVCPSGKLFLRQMDADPEKKKIYTCDETGIYSSDNTMSLTELLVDGRLNSLSDVSHSIQYFYQITEKVFLAFLGSAPTGELKLLRYEYNANLPTQPEQELKIYSLSNDDTIKKLIFDFQSSHPNVLLSYETGMESLGVKNESDAINILNTEIMAGDGPDVLFLNGLPWNSYAKQGILMDLSSIGLTQDASKVFQNLFAAFQTQGKQFAAPISFSIPVLVGEKGKIDQASSLEGLLELAKQTEHPAPLSANNFLPYTFSIFWQEIQKGDGSISKEKIAQLLEYAKTFDDLLQPQEGEILDMFQAVSPNVENAPYYDSVRHMVDIWDIVYGNTASGIGYLGNIRDFTAISDHMPGQNLSFLPFPEHVFTSLSAGINSKSSQTDLAAKFLEFMLSEEEQMVFIDDSLPPSCAFPVNKGAWQAMAAKPSPKKLEEYGAIFQRLGGSFHWPSQEEFNQLEQMASELDTPAMEDTLILSAILDSGGAYLSGNKPLDGAVTEISQMLELYLAESNAL